MKGKFSGRAMHIEYHTVSPKKEKAANCIYLTTDRICQNKESVYYTQKCFAASYCPLKLKKNESANQALKNQAGNKKVSFDDVGNKPQNKMKCTLPESCDVYSKNYGNGKYVGYKAESGLVLVQFKERIIKFQYPNAILEKHLVVPKHAYRQVLHDVAKAERK